MSSRLPQNTSDLSAMAKFTMEKWRSLDSFYFFWTERWRRTLDFIRAQQWKVLQELGRKQTPKWKRFAMRNFTLAFYSDLLSQWLQARVRYSAVPTRPDPESIASAELIEQIMKFLWDELDMEDKRIDLGAWLISTGTAYLRFFWNTNTGNVLPLGIPTPDGGIIPINPETLEVDPSIRDPQMVDVGEIGVEVVSPQFIRWGTNKTDGAMVGSLLTFDEVVNTFGRDAAEKLNYRASHAGIALDLGFLHTPATQTPEEERALVIQHYIPKSSRFPNGVWWTAVDQNKLLTKPNPLPAGEVPIATFRWVPIPGHPKLGTSPIYDITFPNKHFNERLSKLLEHEDKIVPKVLIPEGSGLRPGDFDDEPFQELIFNLGASPEIMESRQPPRAFREGMQQDASDMLTIGGYNFTKPADVPGGIADSIRMPMELKEGQETILAQINSKAGWKKAGYSMIAYVKSFYTGPRVISIQGPDKSYQWREFIGSDIDMDAARIHIDEISLYPWNRQALRDSVIAVLGTDFGQVLLVDEDGSINKDRLDAVLNATGLDTSITSIDPDLTEARNEQSVYQNFSQGDPSQLPQVEFWQDDDKHLEEHLRVLKGMRFKSWAPPAQQAFLQHVQEHVDRINQQAEEESQAFLQQEAQLRQIREQAEVQADTQKMAVETIMEIIKETMVEVLTDAGVVSSEPRREE